MKHGINNSGIDTKRGVRNIHAESQNRRRFRNTAVGNLAWTVDGKFAHDWIDFKGFENRGLTTAAIQVGLTLTR